MLVILALVSISRSRESKGVQSKGPDAGPWLGCMEGCGPITGKTLGEINLEEERLIFARGFSLWSVVSLFWAYGEAVCPRGRCGGAELLALLQLEGQGRQGQERHFQGMLPATPSR